MPRPVLSLSQIKKIVQAQSGSFLGEDFNVLGVTADSKEVRDGYIFVAVSGSSADGNHFIEQAVKRGAQAVVSEIAYSKSQCCAKRLRAISYFQVSNARKALALLSREFYANPSAKVKVTGVTGTNGKTTTVYLIESILKKAGRSVGVLGTINYRFQGRVMPAPNTTPGAEGLQRMLAQMRKSKIRYLAMEVSSHALKQSRVEGVDFHSAIFTNLASDHLDYHRTRQDYFLSKAILFKNLKKSAYAVINNDDPFARKLPSITRAKIITYSINRKSDVQARDIHCTLDFTRFLVVFKNKSITFKTHLIGRHNVYNILAAASWAYAEGINIEHIRSVVEGFNCVPGRLERVALKSGPLFFIDYAHTEDALRCALLTLRQVARGRLITVFGCGGNRDRLKRPRMGRTVSELCDYAIITNDNPRNEDPQNIFQDIVAGIRKDNYRIIPDRRRAIAKAVLLAKHNDTVLIAGKGHENYQIVREKRFSFDDKKVLLECLKQKS